MQPSAQLGASAPIRILMTSGHRNQDAGLKRIGVLFGTYARQNPGEAELRLARADGSVLARRFSLADLADNKYRYFDLDSKHYSAGEIVSISGGGVSAWENHDDKAASTCVNYEYADGKRRFTPGCPPF